MRINLLEPKIRIIANPFTGMIEVITRTKHYLKVAGRIIHL